MTEGYFFMLEDHKTTLHFFYKKNFYMQHQTEI